MNHSIIILRYPSIAVGLLQQFILLFSYHKTKEQIAEEEVLIRAAKDDPNEFSALYDAYYEQIFLFIFKRVQDEHITGEITSMVFYKCLYNLKKYKFKGLPFSAWLYRIASNAVAEYFRKQKKEHRHVSLETSQLNNLLHEVDDHDEADIEKQKAIMVDILSNLKEKEIQLVELRFFEDMSFKEMGEILDLTENNAKVKTFRVLKKMKKLASKLHG